MKPTEDNRRPPVDSEVTRDESGAKKPWTTPRVKASGTFDKAAMACARGNLAFPSCALQPS